MFHLPNFIDVPVLKNVEKEAAHEDDNNTATAVERDGDTDRDDVAANPSSGLLRYHHVGIPALRHEASVANQPPI